MVAKNSLNQDELRQALSVGRFEWRQHILQRLAERGIRHATVLEVLRTGARIEDYPEDTPYPSALFLGWVDIKPLHVVVALDAQSQWAYIITAYEPDLEHFESDYRTRKSP